MKYLQLPKHYTPRRPPQPGDVMPHRFEYAVRLNMFQSSIFPAAGCVGNIIYEWGEFHCHV